MLTNMMEIVEQENKRLVFFSPFANIWSHSLAESLLASGLEKAGWSISKVQCGGVFSSHCVAMAEAGLTEFASEKAKSQVCRSCKKRRDLLAVKFAFESDGIEEFVNEADLLTISEILKSANIGNWQDIAIQGVPLGRFAIYEMWLSHKLVSVDLPVELWDAYLNQLNNTLISFLAGLRYLEQKKPAAVIVYNNRYSVNNAFSAAATQLGIPSYSIHGGWHITRRPTSLSMMKLGTSMQNIFKSESWMKHRMKPIGSREVDLVKEHFVGLWEAASPFAYSSSLRGSLPSEIRSKFCISDEKRILLATMSSEDEILGARLIGASSASSEVKTVFSDQLDWLESVIEYAESRPDTHLLVRLHPRMFPNKREQVLSPTVIQINRIMEHAPENVSLNIPSDAIGLYDLMQIVDVLLNYSSTVGAELAAFGIPVVTPRNDKFETYPEEINKVGRSRQEFFEFIDQALSDGWSIDNSRTSFRWFSFLFTKVAENFEDTIKPVNLKIRPKSPGLLLQVWKKLVFLGLNFGPLVLERLSLRNTLISPSRIQVFDETLEKGLISISESSKWPNEGHSEIDEHRALQKFFSDLCDNEWGHIREQGSLAHKVRSFLYP